MNQGQTAGVQSITVGTTPVTLLKSRITRAGVIFCNESSLLIYVLLGPGTVSATLHSFHINADSPYNLDNYTGIITAVRPSGSGPIMVTEIY